MTISKNSKVERFTAKSDACSFSITGNDLGNYMDPGPGNPYGYQELKGGSGTDTYVLGHDYGELNIINNYATDDALDHLMFNILFHDIKVIKEGFNCLITSIARNESVSVTLKNYFEDELYQHILIHSVDHVIFIPSETEPYIEVKLKDFSDSPFSQIIKVADSSTKIVTGSRTAENHITGGEATVKITGGNEIDTITGGPMDEDIFGLEGDDIISGGSGSDYIFGGQGADVLDGGDGDDVLYGGPGADNIIGGEGSDYIAFSGEEFTGVTVNLQVGSGWSSDAEGDTYTSIENILATEYDDTLVGNDDNNFLVAYAGSDFIVPGGGQDILQGGAGNDFYDLTSAFGRKVIDNFATDILDDVVILKKTSRDSVCHFYLEDDLNIAVNFGIDDFGRIQADKDSLYMIVSHVLKNTTYQHIKFLFSDGELQDFTYFTTNGKQLFAMYTQILSGNIMSVSSNSQNSLQLHFNLTNLGNNPPSSLNYKVQYIHIKGDSMEYSTLSWPSQGQSITTTLSNVISGYEHKFLVILTSCNLVAAVSHEVTYTTPPSSPTNLVTSRITVSGFTISWTAPNSETDPAVDMYEYVITMTNILTGEIEHEVAITDTLSYTTRQLSFGTGYRVSVASVYNSINSQNSPSVEIETLPNNCKILENMSELLLVENVITINGVIYADLYCIEGHVEIGNSRVACNSQASTLPTCEPIKCSIPAIAHAGPFSVTLINPDCSLTSVYPGCEYTWQCYAGYEVDASTEYISSTCSEYGTWTPAIQTCISKPSCTNIVAPHNGQVSSSSVYAGQHVSYSCNFGYLLQGPSDRNCVRNADNTASLSPSDVPTCLHQSCPALLPQPNGLYLQSGVFTAGDTVTLVCFNGYYIRNVVNNPDELVMTCLGTSWDTVQETCKKSIEVVNVQEELLIVKATVRYSFSAWSNRAVDSSLYSEACLLAGGSSTYSSIAGSEITCTRQHSLIHGPNHYAGFLEVSTSEGSQTVCVTSVSDAISVCNSLGYSQYRNSVERFGSHDTTLSVDHSSGTSRLIENSQRCTTGIKCRATCDDLYLLHGNDCYYTLEGQTCYFHCNAGYLLKGDSSRTCSSSGQWSGSHPDCDGEAWKTDVERESRENGGMSHEDLADHLIDYLTDRYDDVLWGVAVYDDVTGGDAHTVTGQYYHLFRHYGHNIVVGRIVRPYSQSGPSDIEGRFRRALALSWKSTCTDSWCWSHEDRINADPTVRNTWSNLYAEGLDGTMLLIIRGNIAGKIVTKVNSRALVYDMQDGGVALLLATAT